MLAVLKKILIATVALLVIAIPTLVVAENGLGLRLNEVENDFNVVKEKIEVVKEVSQKWGVLSGNPPYLGAEDKIKEAEGNIFDAKDWIRKIPDVLYAESNAYACINNANKSILSADAKLKLFIENSLVSSLVREGIMPTEPSGEYATEVLESANDEEAVAKEAVRAHEFFGPFKTGIKHEEGILSVSDDFIRTAEESEEPRLKIAYSMLGESAAREAKASASSKWDSILLLFVCLSVIPVGVGIVFHELRERRRGGLGILGRIWDKISGFWIEMR